MEVAERRIVKPLKDGWGDCPGASDGERPLGFAFLSPGDESMGCQYGSLARGVHFPNAVGERLHGRIVIVKLRFLEHLPDPGRFGIGNRIDMQGAMLITKYVVGRVGAQISRKKEPRIAEKPRGEPHALRTVVISGDTHYWGLVSLDNARESFVEKSDRIGRRNGPVVEVAGKDDKAGLCLRH